MTLEAASKLIRSCAGHMDARYQKVVFDEWALIAFEGAEEFKVRLLAYWGPRKHEFERNFLRDAGTLRAGLRSRHHDVGDFEFARHGVGTVFEAFMVVGDGFYLICNNTREHMDSITRDPRWLNAQVPFAELSDQFRANPLVHPG